MMKQSRVFKVREQLKNIYRGTKAFVLLKKSKKTRLMNKRLKEEIMLSVTYVNGCAMCSFVHTKAAINSGMKADEIKHILSGQFDDIPDKDVLAAVFAEHFADSYDCPDQESVSRLINEYGKQKAELIIAACQMITMTNGMGIALDDLYHRIQFKRNKQSNLLSELLNPLLTMVLFVPLVLYHSIIALFSKPNVLKLVESS
jgi:AhpD family alkylhydroperoxidase